MKVSVLGAGIFGAAGALELAKRGHEVVLIDPGPLPHRDAASTDISKIVRLDYGADVFYTELMERALVRWRALNQQWDRPLFHETGFVVVSTEPLAAGSFERESFDTLCAREHMLDRLDGDAIAARFPQWSRRYVDGYFNPQGGWAESGAVTAQFVQRALEAGVVWEAAVGDVEREHKRADLVVVAAGAWTPTLLPELRPALAVVGQPVFHFAPADDTPWRPPRFVPFAADIGRTGWYGFCANADGIVKVANHGAGTPSDPRSPRVLGDDAEPRFRAFLRDALPALASADEVARRLCLYCDSFDGDFWIARHPHRERVMVAAGGSGHGFKFAPVLGELIADEAEGATPAAISRRFGWREVGARCHEYARCVD